MWKGEERDYEPLKETNEENGLRPNLLITRDQERHKKSILVPDNNEKHKNPRKRNLPCSGRCTIVYKLELMNAIAPLSTRV